MKRVNPEIIGKDAWEIIRLDDGDEVVGAVELSHDLVEFVFITSDAQLLHFPAAGVRPQGRSGGGMAGIKLARGARAIFFGATPVADSVGRHGRGFVGRTAGHRRGQRQGHPARRSTRARAGPPAASAASAS